MLSGTKSNSLSWNFVLCVGYFFLSYAANFLSQSRLCADRFTIFLFFSLEKIPVWRFSCSGSANYPTYACGALGSFPNQKCVKQCYAQIKHRANGKNFRPRWGIIEVLFRQCAELSYRSAVELVMGYRRISFLWNNPKERTPTVSNYIICSVILYLLTENVDAYFTSSVYYTF